MKTIKAYFFIIMLASSKLYSQPDLTINYISIVTPQISHGGLLKAQISVKNIGTIASGISSIGIYLNTSTNTNNAVYLTNISLPSINPGNSYSLSVIYPVPYSVALSLNYLLVDIDNNNKVNEINETNNFYYAITPINVHPDTTGNNHLPYPVILIHGLSSNDQTWSNFVSDIKNKLGWSFGGRLDFCLNQNGDQYNSNFTSDFMDYTNLSNLSSGDFYAINFDVDNSGVLYGNNILSNQSAIYKQGYGVRNAISHIMQVTGKNKVILLGHSMGGLASRDYIQNTFKYQIDNQHHVAKLITLGTPHGGSNAGPTFSPLTPDGQSEAVRDLRTSYFYSNNSGVYLFGGIEDLVYMEDQLCCYFYNADVNCNGIIGEVIVGLNNKIFPNDIDVACNIGDGDILGGDGVVDVVSADLNNYIPAVNADTFILMKTGLTNWHIALTKQTNAIIRSLDEPRNKNYAFQIQDSVYYNGLLNIPSRKYTANNIDIDIFKMHLNTGTLVFQITNIPVNQFTVSILNSLGNMILTTPSNGNSQISSTINVSVTGDYYLKIEGMASDSCQYCQYTVNYVNPTITYNSSVNENNSLFINIYPNPVDKYIYVKTSDFNNLIYRIYSLEGKEIINGILYNGDSEIDVQDLSKGLYILMFYDQELQIIQWKKFIKN